MHCCLVYGVFYCHITGCIAEPEKRVFTHFSGSMIIFPKVLSLLISYFLAYIFLGIHRYFHKLQGVFQSAHLLLVKFFL